MVRYMLTMEYHIGAVSYVFEEESQEMILYIIKWKQQQFNTKNIDSPYKKH